MDCITLLREAKAAGLTVSTEGDRLVVRGPKIAHETACRLLAHKPDVMAALRLAEGQPGGVGPSASETGPETAGIDGAAILIAPGETVVLAPGHPLAGFEWDESAGYCPGRKKIRGGIEHKIETCTSSRSWRHVWGGRYCLACWPPTDPKAVADEE